VGDFEVDAGGRPTERADEEAGRQLSCGEAIEDIEKKIGSETTRHAQSRPLLEWWNKFHEAGLHEVAQKMQWEIEALDLMPRPLGDKAAPYLRPLVGFTNGSSWPNIQEFTEEALDHLEERARVTGNTIIGARYSDIIWERRRKHEFARDAVLKYLAAANRYLELDWGIELAKATARAIELCLLLNDKVLLAKALSVLRRLLIHFGKAEDPRWGVELADIAVALPRSAFTRGLDQATRRYLRHAVQYYGSGKGNSPDLERSVLNTRLALHRTSGEEGEARATLEALAASWEREAHDRETSSNLAAASLYGDALLIYQELGDRAKVDELQVRMRECNARGASEFGVISTEVEIPREEIERLISLYTERETKEALALLSQSFIPNVDEIRRQTEELKGKTPLQFLLPTATYSDDRLVSRALSDADIFEQNVTRSLLLWYTFNAQIIAEIMARLRAKGMQPEDLVEFLLASPVLGAGRKDVLERAIDRYLAGDYISSIHTVVPELEHTIRSILPRLGEADTVVYRKTGIMRVKPLDDVLKRPKLRKALGEDIYRYLYTVLVDQGGMNVRNDVAHGVMASERFNLTTATILLHLLLILTRLRFVAADSNVPQGEGSPT
jgi:hypothetical protein